MTTLLRAAAVAVVAFLFAACQSEIVGLDEDSGDPGGVGTPTPVSYAEDVQTIFTASCAGSGCHVGRTQSGVNLSSWAQTMASVGNQYGTPIVVAGDAGASPIVDKILPNPDHGQRMPAGREALSSSQIQDIRDWIDDGAQDN